MSGRERNIFKTIFKHFMASIKPSFKPHKLMGEDYYGTKYYEVQESAYRKKASRYFVPINKNDFEQELPAEWEAWLRHRRKDAPSMEEVERNYQLQITKKENAAKLEAQYSSVKVEKPKLLSNQNEERRPFPTYEEYKNNGKDYKIKS